MLSSKELNPRRIFKPSVKDIPLLVQAVDEQINSRKPEPFKARREDEEPFILISSAMLIALKHYRKGPRNQVEQMMASSMAHFNEVDLPPSKILK